MASFTRIPAQSGVAFELRKGQHLTVRDPEGEQVADLFCVESGDLAAALSSGRSIDYNDTIRFGTGHRLYSHGGAVMLEIVRDDCGSHDFLVTPCSLQMFRMLDPACDYHPSCEENLVKSLGAFGVAATAITTTFNIFMNVPVKADGSLKVATPLSRPGHSITFLAHKNLVVGLTACSDEGTNNGRCKPIEYRVE